MTDHTRTQNVLVTVETDELRKWAGHHADKGHHGVAHVLYQAANQVETLGEQAAREQALRTAQVEAVLAKCDEWTTEGEELISRWHEREEEEEIVLLSHGSELVDKAATIRRVIEEAGHV